MKQDILTIIIKCGELMIHYFINPLNPIQLPTISEFGGYLPLPPPSILHPLTLEFFLRTSLPLLPLHPSQPTVKLNKSTNISQKSYFHP